MKKEKQKEAKLTGNCRHASCPAQGASCLQMMVCNNTGGYETGAHTDRQADRQVCGHSPSSVLLQSLPACVCQLLIKHRLLPSSSSCLLIGCYTSAGYSGVCYIQVSLVLDVCTFTFYWSLLFGHRSGPLRPPLPLCSSFSKHLRLQDLELSALLRL